MQKRNSTLASTTLLLLLAAFGLTALSGCIFVRRAPPRKATVIVVR